MEVQRSSLMIMEELGKLIESNVGPREKLYSIDLVAICMYE